MKFEKLCEDLLFEVKVDTFKGSMTFSKKDIDDMLSGDYTNYPGDNLTGWLYQALIPSKKSRDKIKKAINSILLDIKKGKIKEVKFMRDSTGMIIGIKNFKISDY